MPAQIAQMEVPMRPGRLTRTVVTVMVVGVLALVPAWGQSRLDVSLALSESVVTDGSVEVLVQVGDAPVSEGVLLVDDTPVGEGKQLPPRFVVDCLALGDGEHRVAVWAADAEGREGRAEAWFLVENPSLRVTAVEAPTTVWPGAQVEVTVETAGEVVAVLADLGALVGEEGLWREAERVGDSRFQLRFEIPLRVVDEGPRPLLVRAIGVDGDELLVEPPDVLLVSAAPMTFTSRVGASVATSRERFTDERATTRVVEADPELVLDGEEGGGVLRVTLAGELGGASLVLVEEGRSGHLLVPVDALEVLDRRVDPSTGALLTAFAVPLEASSKPGDGDGPAVVWAGADDPWGLHDWLLVPIFLGQVELVPDYSVYGDVTHQYRDQNGVTAIGVLDGVRARVLDASGTTVAQGWVDWEGSYRITLPQPTSQSAPYSIQLVTDEPETRVLASTTLQPHSYTHGTTFTPSWRTPYQLDITVPLASSGAFHIHHIVREANAWYRGQKMSPGTTVVVWSQGATPPLGTSYYEHSTGRIYLLGSTADPDQYDDSVILHEIGHRATRLHSRDDSPGGQHFLKTQYTATLAWSEGIATYLGQTVKGSRRYVDRSATGAFDYNLDDMTGVPTGTHDGSESGKLSEALVGAFLWDLDDPVSTTEHDNLSGKNSSTVSSFRAMATTSNLARGISGQADLADFVKLFGCALGASQKSDLNSLLSSRFGIGWLSSSGFCS